MVYTFTSFAKDKRLKDFANSTHFCTMCKRMQYRDKILSDANGNTNSKVLFIAEAPGRLGADRTGIPLYGDRTGDNFEILLKNIGWTREQVFITNAILCNPLKKNDTNRTPATFEVQNCSVYLKMTINLIDPEVVITLGRIALQSLSFIQAHPYNLSSNVAKTCYWAGRKLFPLYHPGPRAMVHRSFAKQTSDFIALSKFVDPIKGIKPKKRSKLGHAAKIVREHIKYNRISSIVTTLFDSIDEMSYFKLMKILYLIDLLALNRIGSTLTGEIYLRQQEGPWIPDLWSFLKTVDGSEIELFKKRSTPYVRKGHNPGLLSPLESKEQEIIMDVILKYGSMTDSQIKTSVYLTKPMKYILTQEKKGRKMLNAPVIYKDKTVINND